MAVTMRIGKRESSGLQFTNLSPNPSFEAASGTVEIRRNYAAIPGGTSLPGVGVFGISPRWYGGSGGSGTTTTSVAVTDHPYGLSTCIRKTWSAVGGLQDVAYSSVASSGDQTLPVTPGEVWSFSYWWRPSFDATGGVGGINRMSVTKYDAAGVSMGDDHGVSLAYPPAGAWQRVSIVYTVPAGVAYVKPFHYLNAGSGLVVGSTIDGTGLLLEKSPTLGDYFDGTEPVKVRRNLCRNPSLETNGDYWTYADTGWAFTRQTSGGYVGPAFARYTHAAGGSVSSVAFGGSGASVGTALAVNMAPGIAFNASAWVRPSQDLTLTIGMNWRRQDGTSISGFFPSAGVSCPAGVWTRISVQTTSPAETFCGGPRVGLAGAQTLAPGTTIDVDGCLVEDTGTLGSYFDGSSTPDPGFGYAWEGTANNSESYMYDSDITAAWTGTVNNSASVLRGASVTSTGGRRVASTQWMLSGDRSIRIIPETNGATNNESWASVGGDVGAMRLSMEENTTYTVLATIRLAAPLTGTLHTNARKIVPFYRIGAGSYMNLPSTAAANVAGVTTLVHTFTIPAGSTEAFIRLYNGAPAYGGDVWWDDFLLIEGVYTGDYFDGSTPDEPFTGAVYDWTGAANASTSTKTFPPGIDGHDYELKSASISEDSSPINVLDSSGAVGSGNFSLGVPENPDNPVRKYGASWLIDKEFDYTDTRYGFVSGTLDSASESDGAVSASGVLRTGKLNVYNVQAQPVWGTLEDAFVYYLSLAGITSGYAVDPSIASRSVAYMGWNGELWFNLKQMASAQQCDITLIGGVITLRPIRERTVVADYLTTKGTSAGSGMTAQKVEAYYYETDPITDELAYPPNGWNPEVEILNVNAGEEAEYTIELGASLASFQEPVMQTFVAESYDSSSVYTVVGDDGFPIAAANWAARGGSVTFELNPDTVTMTVRLRGPENVPMATGEYARSFSVALASAASGNRYSTLRIVGTGVRFQQHRIEVRTGLTPQQTGTEIGATIDNPFVNNLADAYGAGATAAKSLTGLSPSLSGSVIRAARAGSPDPTFGNVAGARFWDRVSRRWYRIRTATFGGDNINFDAADDDLTNDDMLDAYEGLTYGDVQTLNDDLTYQEARLAGART